MFKKSRYLGFAAGVALALAAAKPMAADAPALAPAAAAKTSIADFFRPPDIRDVQLSPDGSQLLAIVSNGPDHVGLAVINIKNLKESKVIVASDELHIEQALWVNSQRIVFTVKKPPGTEDVGPGLWAVNNDGGDLRQLIDHRVRNIETGTSVKNRSLPWDWGLFKVLDDGSDDVIVEQFTFDTKRQLSRTNLARLNTRTHERTTLGVGAPVGSKDWVLDRQGQPMWATTLIQGQVALHVKKAPSDSWQVWATGPMVPGVEARPAWVGPGREVYVMKRQSERQTTALYRLDAQTWAPEPTPLVSIKGYDLEPKFIYDAQAKRLLGLHFDADARSSIWFDPVMKAAQAEVDKQLGATVNLLHCKRCTESSTVLVEAFSDRTPTAYYLYDRESKALSPVGSSRPWIDPKRMAGVDVQEFKARDGLAIPVQITRPKVEPKKPLPTVVLVHGGPHARGNYWEWNAEAQFLASRGYLVVEPEFRGSTGYGFTHFHAGWKQWGRAMQDDVTDATQWAIQKGLADPKRICIAGASYGGYATLMGLIREPDLYQCGINWVGVTDLELLYTVNWSDASDASKDYSMPVLIGDPENPEELKTMRANSPLLRAREIKQPLLMAYGFDDVRVPVVHGTKLRDAIQSNNKQVEWVAYTREAHGWKQMSTQQDFWGRVERMLDKHIGTNAAP